MPAAEEVDWMLTYYLIFCFYFVFGHYSRAVPHLRAMLKKSNILCLFEIWFYMHNVCMCIFLSYKFPYMHTKRGIWFLLLFFISRVNKIKGRQRLSLLPHNQSLQLVAIFS